jgi:hypothetical protein
MSFILLFLLSLCMHKVPLVVIGLCVCIQESISQNFGGQKKVPQKKEEGRKSRCNWRGPAAVLCVCVCQAVGRKANKYE